MNMIKDYTMDHIRKNRRSSRSICIAVLIASTLLCSLCILIHTIWAWGVEKEITGNGSWHGELNNIVRGDQLTQAEGNPHVKAAMIKGKWEALQLPENAKLPYLILRDADKNYWENMGEKNVIMEGRIPQKPGEIAVSKSFLDNNPQFQIGDTLTLPAGYRIQDQKRIEVQDIQKEGETFAVTGMRELTIVGKLDMTTSTVYPGYYAMGFLERSAIRAEDELTVYLQMKEMQRTYSVLPQIAVSLGWEKDEFGEYPLRYHGELLALYGVMPPDQKFSPESLATPLMFLILAIIAVGAFVLMIHSAFTLSADGRIKQLGMFRSVGATPKQIRSSILYEGIILSIIPIAAGIGLGYVFSGYVAGIFTKRLGELAEDLPMQVTFSWFVVLGAAGLSFLTVLLSASIPARRMAKLSPIEAIRQAKGGAKLKKPRKIHLLSRLFGFYGELAADSFAAHRRSFSACISSLVMCIVLAGGMICIMCISDLVNIQAQKKEHFDINVNLSWADEADETLLSEIRSVPGVKESITLSVAKGALWVKPEDETPQFTHAGGLSGVDQNRFNVIKRDGKYRVAAYLIGMDDKAFSDYCTSLGQNPDEFLKGDIPKAIAVNAVFKHIDTRDKKRMDEKIPFLRLTPGETLTLHESNSDSVKSNYTFPLETTFITDQLPVTDRVFNYYSMQFFMPMKSYYAIVKNYLPERALSYYSTEINLLAGDENSPKVQKTLEELCKSVMAEEDYMVDSKLGRQERRAISSGAFQAVFNSIAVLLGLIGVFNSFTAVANNMRLRRREFAMLRSVGMDSAGIGRLLLFEGSYFAIMPVLLSIPFLYAICAGYLWLANLSWAQLLPIFPLGRLMLCAFAVMAAEGFSYWLSARKLKKDTIMDAIKDETT